MTARLLPAGDGPSDYGLHLVLGRGADGVEAPVPLPLGGDAGATHVWLAAIMGGDGSVAELAALKILSSSPPPEGPGRATNRELWERFVRERSRITELSAAARFFPRLLQPAGETADREELPPLLFCRTHRTFFVTPCPTCGRGLETCRDETFLAESGLPPFLDSPVRQLWCPACSHDDAALSVFSYAAPSRPPRRPVGGPEELLTGVARGLLRDWDDERLAGFACRSCAQEARGARKEGGASLRSFGQRWAVFTFTDTPLLVTALSPLRWDEWGDLVGGRDPAALRPEADADALRRQADARRLASFTAPSTQGERLLFGYEGTGLDAVEVLYLKLRGFSQLLRAVLEFSRRTGQPHLGLHPEHVVVDAPQASEGLPPMWGSEIRLLGLAGARVVGSADGPSTLLPPSEPVHPYAAPEVLEFHLAAPRPSDVYVSGVHPSAGTGGVRLEGRLVDPNGLFPRPEPTDVVQVSFPGEGLWGGPPNLVLRVRPGSTAAYEEMTFRSDPADVDEAFLRKLEKLQGVRFPGVRYKVYPRFGPATDLYSLGILLLRILAAGEKDDFTSTVQGLSRLSMGLKGTGRGTQSHVSRFAAAAGGDEMWKVLLDRGHVFFSRADRQAGRPSALPPELWTGALALAARLATRVPGFSFCGSSADWNAEEPAGRLEEALVETERLIAELRALLFDRQGIHREIRDVLLEVLDDEKPAGERT